MLKYIMGFLVVLVVVLSISTYNLIGDLAVAEREMTAFALLANKNAKQAENVKASCDITLESLRATQKVIDTLNEARQDDLSALEALPQVTLPEIKINASKTPTAPSKNADDLRLSPDTMRLLDNAYCSGAKGDSYCTTR